MTRSRRWTSTGPRRGTAGRATAGAGTIRSGARARRVGVPVFRERASAGAGRAARIPAGDGGSVVAPCALIGVRGLPPVERFLEASLCHDRGAERTTPDKADAGGAGRRRAAVAAPPLAVDDGRGGVDVIVAASRGIVSRVDGDGALTWQTRHAPTWRDRDLGGYVLAAPGDVVVIVGDSQLQLLHAADGSELGSADVPAAWDDEKIQQRPFLEDDLLVVVTQFQTVGFELKFREHVGGATTKLAVLVAVGAAVALVWVAGGDEY